MMMTYNLLFLTILAAPFLIDAVLVNDGSAPDCSIYANGVHLPDETSCSSYYLCRHGRAVRRRCARGFAFDANIMYCNFAALVDCSRVGRANLPNLNTNSTEDSNSTLTTTTASRITTTPCAPTTTPCAPTTTPCAPTTSPCVPTTTPCIPTTTSCAPPTTPCAPTTTPCAPTTTPCAPTTTPCAPITTPPCTATTPHPTPCTSTTPCPRTETPPCTGTPPPDTTTTPCPPTTETSLDDAARILRSRRDCQSLPDGTTLLDGRHCRRFYVCRLGRARKLRCNQGQWFDYQQGACRSSADVTNCPAQRN